MIQPKQITNSPKGEWVNNEYSSISPFNSDNTRILLVKRDHFGLYDGAGVFIKDLPIPASAEPRWSTTDARLFYFIRGNQLLRWKVDTDTAAIVRTFAEYINTTSDGRNGITGAGESDISDDGKHLALCGNRRDVFVYDIANDVKGPVSVHDGFDGLKITSANKIVLSRAEGIYYLDGTTPRKVATANGHAAVCRDLNGDDVLIWANAADRQPLAGCNNGVVKIDLATGKQTCLLSLDWSLAMHISACNKGFALVSTYRPDPNAATTPYTNKLLKVALDGSGAEVLCDHMSKPTYYNAQPKAALSRDGSRFAFSSNSGGRPNEPDYADVFLGVMAATAPVPVPVPTVPAQARRWTLIIGPGGVPSIGPEIV